MWPLVIYSNCSKIISTLAFLVSQISSMFIFNTVILYHYTISNYNDYTTTYVDKVFAYELVEVNV